MKSWTMIGATATAVIAAAALATDRPPSGFTADIDNGDIVSGVHKTQARSPGRAEWRKTSVRSGAIAFDREMKVNGGANISLVQFLNIKGSGLTGSSEPISQLVADNQRDGQFDVTIEQGDHSCGFTIEKGTRYRVQAGIDKGGVGWFKVNGKWCQRPNGDPDRQAGYPEDDGYSGGTNAYYLKYGAYNAGGSSVASSVSWR